MKLDAWLALKGLKQADFAQRISVSAVTVHRIINGMQNIPLSVTDSISTATEGAVTAEDLRMAWAEKQRESAA